MFQPHRQDTYNSANQNVRRQTKRPSEMHTATHGNIRVYRHIRSIDDMVTSSMSFENRLVRLSS